MRKATLNISFDEEKYSTMKLYLDQKGISIEEELVRYLESLYTKTVPSVVREFLDTASKKINVSTDNGRSICIVFQGVFMISHHILLVVST